MVTTVELGRGHHSDVYPTGFATIALTVEQLERNLLHMQTSQPARYKDWMTRHEGMHPNREYSLPRIREIYSRAMITDEQREALRATRRVIQAVTARTFRGSKGAVAEWTQILDSAKIDPRVEHTAPTSVAEVSLKDCLVMMREASYDISEGVRFVRTPLVLPRLERKYYLLDLQQY